MFISPAFADEAAGAAAQGGTGGIMSLLPILLVVIVFYFMVIRPQGQRIREHRAFIDGLKKGDKVVTGGGLVATIVRVPETGDEIVLKLADGVEVTAVRSTIISVRNPADAEKK